MQSPALAAAHVLMFALWGAKKMNIRVDLPAVVADIMHCREVLVALEPSYQFAEYMRWVISQHRVICCRLIIFVYRQNLDSLTVHEDGTTPGSPSRPAKRSFSGLTTFPVPDADEIPDALSFPTAAGFDAFWDVGGFTSEELSWLAAPEAAHVLSVPPVFGEGSSSTQVPNWDNGFLPLWLQTM
jgi:hypothetical protein